MRKLALLCPALAATLAAADRTTTPECPQQAGSDVTVTAQRFGDGRSYAFLVTNNSPSAILGITIGWPGATPIEGSVKTMPVTIGSPSGWKGKAVRSPDPRLPGSHPQALISYEWTAHGTKLKDFGPGRSLSGFAVQLPTPSEAELAYLTTLGALGFPTQPPKDPPIDERFAPQPDLRRVSFLANVYEGRCRWIVGMVVPDQEGRTREDR